MNLPDKIKKSDHYVKDILNVVRKAVNIFVAAATILLIISAFEVQAQNEGILSDTIYGTGILLTKNIENNAPISNVVLSVRPENMAMATPDTTYTFITNSNGMKTFDNPGLPVYIDSTTGIEELSKNKVQVVPNFGSELNAFFPEIEKGFIEIYNMTGQLVKRQEFNDDKEYLRLNNVAAGMYIYNIHTESGIELKGKFIKQNSPLRGPAARPRTSSLNFKETQFYEAQYWVKWEHPDFYTDSTLITIE